MLKLLKHLKTKEWIMAAISVAFIVLQVYLELKIPEYMFKITELIITPGTVMKDIRMVGWQMISCAIGSLLAAVIVGFFAARIAATFAYRVRSHVYNKVESFSMEEIEKFSTSSLITRSTNDITQVQMLIAMGFQVIIKAPVMAIWTISKIVGKSWQWSLITVSAIVMIMILVSIIIIFAIPRFKKIQQLTDNLNRVTRENLTGVRVVRAYNAEKYQQGKFEVANEELTSNYLFTSRIMSSIMPSMTLIISMLSLLIYWIGAYIINNAVIMSQKLSLFSDMVVYSQYAMMVVMSFMMIVMVFIMLPRALVSVRRINEVLGTKAKIVDGENKLVPWTMGEIEFKNVSFKYPNAAEYVIKDVNLKINSGETVAFIGSTGSGKSTIVNLIPRFYDVTDGSLLIDGIDVREYKQKELHNKIGYVSQKAVIFSGTVGSNVSYGDNGQENATETEIIEAVTMAQSKDFVEQMPDKYNSHISQGGTNLSGGQKQRIAIARAICRKPEIFIFDDSFSALDYKTDRELRTVLKNQTVGVTTLIVAQRIGTIKDADKIVVLDDGNVVGIGSHKELMDNCEVYRQIAYSQLSKEELQR